MNTFADFGITVTATSGNVKTQCPRCGVGKRDKDLSVNVTDGVWHCHSAKCGFSGSLGKAQKTEFPAVKTNAQPPEEPIYEFFRSRGISREVVDRNRITMEARNFSTGKFKAVCFNYFVGDVLVNIKYRRTTEKEFSQSKGGTPVAYKLNDLKGQTEAIFTEGEIDALSFEMAGFTNAISAPMGAINENDTNVEGKLKFLDNCADAFKAIKRVYLATDADAPGVRLREELARRLGKGRCFVVTFPEGCKDANDVLLKLGSARLKECIEKAQPFPLEGVFDLSSREDLLDVVFEQGFPVGAKAGFTNFDKLFSFFGGQLTVITGIPGHGKSNFIDQIAVRLASLHGWKTGFFTPENSPLETHLLRLCEITTGKAFLPGSDGKMSKAEYQKAKDFIRDKFFYINPENEGFTIEQIFERASYLVLTKGINALVIDPWNTIEHQIKRGENDIAYIARTLNKIRYFARNHGLHIFLVAHPTKMGRQNNGLYDVPTLYNVSGSAHFFNIADNGLCVYRQFTVNEDTGNIDYEYSTVKVFVQKVKHKFMGRTGMAEFEFDTVSQSYLELGEGKQILDYSVPDAEEPPPGFIWKSKPSYAGYSEEVGF